MTFHSKHTVRLTGLAAQEAQGRNKVISASQAALIQVVSKTNSGFSMWDSLFRFLSLWSNEAARAGLKLPN